MKLKKYYCEVIFSSPPFFLYQMLRYFNTSSVKTQASKPSQGILLT